MPPMPHQQPISETTCAIRNISSEKSREKEAVTSRENQKQLFGQFFTNNWIVKEITNIPSATSPRFTVYTAGTAVAGFFFIFLFTPIFVYVFMRRPLWEEMSEFIPQHITEHFNHVPRKAVFRRGNRGEFVTACEVAREFTVGYFGSADRLEPVNWRNLVSRQEQIINICLLELIHHGVYSPRFGWTVYCVSFFLAPVFSFYTLLWLVALLKTYEPFFLGFVAFLWALLSLGYINYLLKSLLLISRGDGRALSPKVPTRANLFLGQLISDFDEYPLRLVAGAANITFSILLISYLTYLAI